MPQPEDVIKASAMDICNNLQDVHDDVLPLFIETAQHLIEQKGGDATRALCTALAVGELGPSHRVAYRRSSVGLRCC